MNPRIAVVAAVAAFALSCLPVWAAAPKPAPPSAATALPSYESLDGNGDGVVTLPEVTVRAPELAKRIVHCDGDRDRRLSRKEYAACKPAPAHAG
ncbi:hypothetical protein SAMN04487939_106266 [Lysobacter sp. yr284]|uniref:hypothetical protein n=1 Tax=Lysobacter TaxID=68 RepID=UPI00089B0F59|nr:hypothetical protein [Lysobacter sp. yr284]SDY82322.1 hypothetical protein SAMN04487939_106266 [Lysobacter sp. yr284]